MEYLLGIDIGTSAAKALLINESGEVTALAGEEYQIDTPRPGWAEQDPDTWWDAAKLSICKVLRRSSVNPQRISGIGLSGQMHGTVLLGKDLRVIRPAIIWADQRTKRQCDQIYANIGRERLIRITANPVAPGFMAPTLLWIRENEPKKFEATDKVLLPADYVRFRLCGKVCTDATNASSSLLFDTRQRHWSAELLEELGLPSGVFPPVIESTAVAGRVTRQAALETGLAEGTPVVTGGGDQPIAAVGNGVIAPGNLLSTIGTGGQLFGPLDEVIVDPQLRIHTFCHVLPGKWFLMGAILSAGLCLRWFRDNFGGSYAELDREAATIPVGSDGLLFLPYLIGERTPHMDPNARGMFFGLSLCHSRAHLIRAIMEGVVLAMRDSLEIMRKLGTEPHRLIASGGGARSALWRQIQADVYNMELTTAEVPEQAAFGAALVAGVGTGVYESVETACQKTITYSSPTYPIQENVRRYQEYYQVFKGLYPKLKGDFQAVSELR
jgi:xylulokinase